MILNWIWRNGALMLVMAVGIALYSLVPLRGAVQIGADEGFEMGKAVMLLDGYKLYSEVWNDQPPMHTALNALVLKHLGKSILYSRLLTVAFAFIFLCSTSGIISRSLGPTFGALGALIVLASPGFLELSSSCM